MAPNLAPKCQKVVLFPVRYLTTSYSICQTSVKIRLFGGFTHKIISGGPALPGPAPNWESLLLSCRHDCTIIRTWKGKEGRQHESVNEWDMEREGPKAVTEKWEAEQTSGENGGKAQDLAKETRQAQPSPLHDGLDPPMPQTDRISLL